MTTYDPGLDSGPVVKDINYGLMLDNLVFIG